MNTPKENLEMLQGMASDGYETARQLADINLRTWNNIVEKQMDMYSLWLETGVKQIELSSNAKDQKEFLGSQTTLVQEMGEKLIASGRDAISSSNEVQGEYRAWYEKSVQSMTNDWTKVGK